MQALLQARREIAGNLVEPIRAAVMRRDTGHSAFHGCIDWHSAVHGTWALVAYTRMTGDTLCAPLIEETLTPENVAAERRLLRTRPDFEMPYGRAWFLRLAREHALYTGSAALAPMADEVLDSLLAYYRARTPDPHRGSYASDSWALINMLEYATWSGHDAASAAVRRLVEAHFLDHHGRGCDYALETGHFMAVATNWAWLVSKVLPHADFARWAQNFFADAGLPRPVVSPVNWHHHGLNFSRAWGLWALHAAGAPGDDAREAYRMAYAIHFHATYDTPALWRGSYQGVAHWVPQFGMLALQPLFETSGEAVG